ncbi:hypothetical protein MAR_005804 [Mya arenaria]|uniref:NADH dehydrogenase subunit 4L n=1 Tax=Mya arenaria TaxID=6604 RepID=A0ABY7F3B6_MYAAR|nr:hypothetical protein MAR_005804 [Mya arenaria]
MSDMMMVMMMIMVMVVVVVMVMMMVMYIIQWCTIRLLLALHWQLAQNSDSMILGHGLKSLKV